MKLLTQTEKSAEKRLSPLIGAELLFDSLDFAYDFGKITDPSHLDLWATFVSREDFVYERIIGGVIRL